MYDIRTSNGIGQISCEWAGESHITHTIVVGVTKCRCVTVGSWCAIVGVSVRYVWYLVCYSWCVIVGVTKRRCVIVCSWCVIVGVSLCYGWYLLCYSWCAIVCVTKCRCVIVGSWCVIAGVPFLVWLLVGFFDHFLRAGWGQAKVTSHTWMSHITWVSMGWLRLVGSIK